MDTDVLLERLAAFFGPCPHRRPVLYALDSTARPSSAAARWIQHTGPAARPHRRPVLYALDSTARPSSAAARWIQTSCLSVWQEVHIGVTQDLRLHPSRRSNFCSSWLLRRFLDGLRDTSSSSFYSQPIRLPSTTIWLTPCELFGELI